MGKITDISGNIYGRLKVDSFAEMRRSACGHTSSYWNCTCECGNKIVVSRSYLTSGNVRSCGCLKAELNTQKWTKHGKSNTRIYKIYEMMKDRCFNPKSNAYRYYGGKGIEVCNDWLGESGFDNFYNWSLENGYSDELTIDRINPNRNYSPDNCRWIPFPEQARNKTNCHYIMYNGEISTLSELSRKLHIDRGTIRKYEKKYNGDGQRAIEEILKNTNHTRKMKKVEVK